MEDFSANSVIYNEDSMLHPFSRRSNQLRQKLSEWFLAYRHLLLAYTQRHVDGVTDAEHLLSVVLKKVVKVVDKGNLPEQAWLPYTYTAIRHEAIRFRYKNAKRLATELQYGEKSEAVEFRFPVSDEQEQIRNLLDSLPPLNQCIIRMKIWDELPIAEIARQLGMPESTVRARYQAALNQLRKHITPDKR